MYLKQDKRSEDPDIYGKEEPGESMGQAIQAIFSVLQVSSIRFYPCTSTHVPPLNAPETPLMIIKAYIWETESLIIMTAYCKRFISNI